MQFELKPISKGGVGEALEKAERYRLLNEPSLAESICLDVLHIDPDNQQALIMLLLAITDQFGQGAAMGRAREILPRLEGEYRAAILCRHCLGTIRPRATSQGLTQCRLRRVRGVLPGHGML